MRIVLGDRIVKNFEIQLPDRTRAQFHETVFRKRVNRGLGAGGVWQKSSNVD